MSRRKPYRKRKMSARQKRNLFFGILIVLLFVVSFIVAFFFVVLPATG